jgi:hypothetical protein
MSRHFLDLLSIADNGPTAPRLLGGGVVGVKADITTRTESGVSVHGADPRIRTLLSVAWEDRAQSGAKADGHRWLIWRWMKTTDGVFDCCFSGMREDLARREHPHLALAEKEGTP